MLIWDKLLTKNAIIIYSIGTLHEKYGVWIKAVPKIDPKSKFPAGLGKGEEWLSRSKVKKAFLIDSDAELFLYLIQCMRFAHEKFSVWRNRALVT